MQSLVSKTHNGSPRQNVEIRSGLGLRGHFCGCKSKWKISRDYYIDQSDSSLPGSGQIKVCGGVPRICFTRKSSCHSSQNVIPSNKNYVFLFFLHLIILVFACAYPFNNFPSPRSIFGLNSSQPCKSLFLIFNCWYKIRDLFLVKPRTSW